MEQEILTELQRGPKTLEELCFRLDAISSTMLHYLQTLAMRGIVKAVIIGNYDVWGLV